MVNDVHDCVSLLILSHTERIKTKFLFWHVINIEIKKKKKKTFFFC